MARAQRTIEVGQVAEVLRVVEEARDAGGSAVLTCNGEQIAVLNPVEPSKPKRRRKTGIVTENDPFWDIIGIAKTEGPTDVSQNKHKYLAEAYADTHQ